MTRRKAKVEPSANLIVVSFERAPHQFGIENALGSLENFEKDYVNFSGFFGRYDPHLFAAAPDLAVALKAMVAAAEEIRFDNMKGPLAKAKAAMRAAKIA